jgi:hypothetical protein
MLNELFSGDAKGEVQQLSGPHTHQEVPYPVHLCLIQSSFAISRWLTHLAPRFVEKHAVDA